MPSASRIASSIARRKPSASVSPISDTSSRLRRREIGLRRSCAMLSATPRIPVISPSIWSSMAFRLVARRSNSSRLPRTGMRRVRSPCRMSSVPRLMPSIRASRLRLISMPPAMPSTAGQDQAADQRVGHQLGEIGALGHVAPDQQVEAADQLEGAGPRHLGLGIPADIGRHQEVDRAVGGAARDRRPGRQVALDPVVVAVGQQIQAAPARGGLAALADDAHQAQQAELAVLLGQAGDLGLDGVVGLRRDHPHRLPVHEAQHAGDGDPEHQHVDDRIAEGGAAEDPNQMHGDNIPRRARSAAAARRSPCRSSAAAG